MQRIARYWTFSWEKFKPLAALYRAKGGLKFVMGLILQCVNDAFYIIIIRLWSRQLQIFSR